MAEAICSLHSYDPPLVHGHLSPYNLFVGQTKVLVGDPGFDALTKHAGLFNNYRNKSAYSAPELLSGKGNTIVGPTSPNDVYSFGMILW